MKSLQQNKNIINSLSQRERVRVRAGFTLVELIVVISILAILGTIAFLSFGGFSSKARDGSRISDTSSLSKGLELYSVTAGKYPAPEQISGTGIIGTTPVAYLGTIQNQISSLTKISKTPKDPLSNNYYIYGTTLDLKQYQIATTLENTIAYNNNINLPLSLTDTLGENKVYADGPSYQAKVIGNYKGLIKFSSGTTNPTTWLSNIPSLIYNSGSNLLDTNTYYSIDKSTNLPYIIQNATNGNIKADEIIKQITNNQTATLTGVDITNIKTKEDIETYSGTLKALGYDLSIVNKTILGTSLSTTTTIQEETPAPTNSCNTTEPTCSPTGCTLSIGTPTTVNQSWVKGASNCGFNCNTNYSGENCEIYTDPNTISQTICTNAGWYWINDTLDTIGTGFCISPRVTGGTEYISWMDIGTSYNWTRTNSSPLTTPAYANNLYGVTYDLGLYTCKPLGTAISDYDTTDNLQGRMKWLATNKTSSTELDSIDWVTVPSKPSTLTTPAIMISDCIDGVRNLATGNTYNGVTYEQYSAPTNDSAGRINMNNYLLGWSKSSGSHLPSAYSDISSELINNLTTNKGEYQIACEASLLTDSDNGTYRIQLSSVGNQTGAYWGMYSRILGSTGCGSQISNGVGYRTSGVSARFVVR